MTKTCMNCEHRLGEDFSAAKCIRTGFYCTTELNYGGRCAGPRDGPPQLNLWEQRQERPEPPTFWARIKSKFSSPAGAADNSKESKQ